jgi:LysR family glycine cleavage system transcriptional activator
MRKLPPLKAVQAFETAARLGSVLKASEELSVTPSAISHQIRFLEEELGVRLFHRAHRSIILTDVGRRYAEELGASFTAIEAATRAVGRERRSDILSLHVVPSLAAQWLMPQIGRFTSDNPEIDLRLHASTDRVDLMSGAVDLDIRYGSVLEQSGVIVEPFPPETIVVLCAPSLTEGDKPIRSAGDLNRHALIHSEVNLFSWRDWQCAHPGVELNLGRGLRFDRSFMSISAAIEGRGVCLESRLLVQRELASGSLVMPLGPEGPSIRCHSLAYVRSRRALPKVASFRDWLFRALPAG